MFNRLFGKKSGDRIPHQAPGSVCRLIAAYLDCPCEVIPEGTEYGEVIRLFHASVAEGKARGFVPVLIAANEENLAESLYDNAGLADIPEGDVSDGNDFALDEARLRTLRDYRAHLIAAWQKDDAEKYLQTRIAECAEDGEFDLEEEWGGDEIFFEFVRDGITAPFNDDTQKSYELLLAKIPVSEPWQVAAWLPMGGWNECPAPEDMLAMVKRWYERYGAVICSVTFAELEFRVSNPPADMDDAYALAKEQYYFCQDRVEQYANEYSLKTLADNLTKSPYWYFWWD